MIRDPECPRDWTPMVYDMGPKCDPTQDGNVDIAEMWRCEVCDYTVAVHQHTWSDTEIGNRVDAVLALHGVADLDERGKVLAKHGYTPGKRWWPRVEA